MRCTRTWFCEADIYHLVVPFRYAAVVVEVLDASTVVVSYQLGGGFPAEGRDSAAKEGGELRATLKVHVRGRSSGS
jgi:hypothetical protein